MNELRLTKANIDLAEYKMRSATEADYTTLLTEDTRIVDDVSGEVIAVYMLLDGLLDEKPLVKALQRIPYHATTRTGGLRTLSRIFGFRPRNAIRADYCSSTSLAVDMPEEHQVVADYAAKVSALYAAANGHVFDKHLAESEARVTGDWRIKNTPFTSGIINKNNPLKYHFDGGNFTDVWSAMLVFKHRTGGGYLSLPEYGVGVELKNNCLFLFDGQSVLHGVTPIKKEWGNSYRYSIVYYTLKMMWNCLPIDDEILRIRNVKSKREVKRATS